MAGLLGDSEAFSGYSVDDVEAAKEFYGTVLGVEFEDLPGMGLSLKLKGANVFLYHKPEHVPATFTVLNFTVPDIDTAVDALVGAGVAMERYEDMPMAQDDKGIAHTSDPAQGPAGIAWFKDPAGNILSLIQQ